MPTGYTADVAKRDDMTFNEFIMNCARAFGALVLMRDDPADAPIPDEFKPSDYHEKEILRLEQELRAVSVLTNEAALDRAKAENNSTVEQHRQYRSDRAQQRERYENMLRHVRAWKPPTPEHNGLKRFMIEQLVESIKFDCGIYHEDLVPPVNGEQWRADKLASITKSLAYHRKENAEEIKRTRERNEWVRALRKSLE